METRVTEGRSTRSETPKEWRHFLGQTGLVFQLGCKPSVIWQSVFDSHLAHP